MSVYAIILQKPDEKTWATVRRNWPDRHYIWHEYTAFIAPTGITTANFLSELLGFNENKKVTGIVSELASRDGYVETGLVEWLKNANK